MGQKHGGPVKGIVFSCQDRRLTATVPVEVGVQQGLGKISVRHPVSPLALSLESSGNRIVSEGFFLEAHLLHVGQIFLKSVIEINAVSFRIIAN